VATAEGDWFHLKDSKSDETTFTLPKKYVDYSLPQDENATINNPHCDFSYLNITVSKALNNVTNKNSNTYSCNFESKSVSKDETIQTKVQTMNPIINYIPQSIGIFAGIHLNLDQETTQNLGRVSNLLVYLALFSIAIIICPVRKWFIVIAGANPVSVFLASSLSADALLISLTALFLCLLYKVIFKNEKIKRKTIIAFSVLGFLLIFVKNIYFVMILLLLLLSNDIIR
jgi:uncharacterized membrane protein